MSKQTIQVMEVDKLKKTAVIDDAFDDVAENEISILDFREFFQEAEDQITPELARLKIEVPDISDWDENSAEFLDFLRKLWKYKSDDVFASIINHPKLFQNKLTKFEELNQVCNNLRSLNFEVETFDSDFLLNVDIATLDFIYIFIDYNLGIQNGIDAQNHAKEVISKIYNAYPENNRPVTVLMSTFPNINELAENFKNDSGLLEGIFRSTPKTDLTNANKISLLTKAFEEAFYCNHALQEYIDTFVNAASKAQDKFKKDVRRLNVEDYEFIQNSVLDKEQHPLGDYLVWLYGSHWSNLLNKDESLKAQQAKIDKVISINTPFHTTRPSQELAGIFMSALFEDNLEKVKPHPLYSVSPEVLNLPYLHLGDLFSKPRSKTVYLILNPQCDLERPRVATQSTSILLLPGNLHPLDNTLPSESKTDFFVFEDKQYQIFWELKQAISVPYNEFDKWTKDRKLDRKFRLRLPFALEVQQKFTSTLSRVGLPVSPPMTKSISLKVNFRATINDEFEEIIPASDEYAFLPINGKKNEKIRLTLNFALELKEALIKKGTELTAVEAGEGEKPKNLFKTIQKINTFVEEFDDWFFKTRSFNKPTTEKYELKSGLIDVILENGNIDKIQSPFWISVIETVDENFPEDEVVKINPQNFRRVRAKIIKKPTNYRGKRQRKRK